MDKGNDISFKRPDNLQLTCEARVEYLFNITKINANIFWINVIFQQQSYMVTFI